MKLIRNVKINIPSDYKPQERKAISTDIVDFIRKRTAKGLDKNNKPFPKYSKSYTTSAEFKMAGKSKKVNLEFTGDMMDELEPLKDSKGVITIGYEKGSDLIGRVTGNILGTYGNDKPLRGKKRDFLGISKGDLKTILSRYPLTDRKKSEARASLLNAIDKYSKAKVDELAETLVASGAIDAMEAEEIINEAS